MSSRQFLLVCGGMLIIFGLLGYVLPDGQLLGSSWFLTGGENIAHLFIGVIALSASYIFDGKMQIKLVQIIAVTALFFAVFGFMVRDVPPLNTFNIANLENPYDNIVHLLIGLWGVFVGFFLKEKVVELKESQSS